MEGGGSLRLPAGAITHTEQRQQHPTHPDVRPAVPRNSKDVQGGEEEGNSHTSWMTKFSERRGKNRGYLRLIRTETTTRRELKTLHLRDLRVENTAAVSLSTLFPKTRCQMAVGTYIRHVPRSV